MPKRRKFLRTLSTFALLTPWLARIHAKNSTAFSLEDWKGLEKEDLVKDERFWHQIKQAYTVSPSIVNLNNGGVSPQPLVVQQAVERYNRMSNEIPSYYMWRILNQGREGIREKLAEIAACSSEEIAIHRNTSEALETVIFGLRLKANDEVVMTHYDYPNMENAWKQRAHRDGVVLKYAEIDPINGTTENLEQAFLDQFTPRTKVVHITHIINWNGCVLPVARIAKKARERGIEVIVDGAHSFAHLNFTIPELNCDYFGTSLHKWLCAPFGSGMLYVRKEKIKNLYPLFAAVDPESDDIRKFENMGTRSNAIEQAIGQAIDFHFMIGPELKEERLRYLKEYWVERLKKIQGIKIHSPIDDSLSCSIAMFSIEGVESLKLSSRLLNENQVHTVSIQKGSLDGIRVTPNVYTLTSDLDRFIRAVKEYT